MMMRAAVLLCCFLALGGAQQSGTWLDFNSKSVTFAGSGAPRCDGGSYKSPWFTIKGGSEIRWTLLNNGCTKQLFDDVDGRDIGLHVYGTIVRPGSGVWIDGKETEVINDKVHPVTISIYSGGKKIDGTSAGGCDKDSQHWWSDKFPQCQGVTNPLYSQDGIHVVVSNPSTVSREMRVVAKSSFPIPVCVPQGCDVPVDTGGKGGKAPKNPGKGSPSSGGW